MSTNTTTNLRAAIRKLDNPIVIMFAVANVFFVAAVAAMVGRADPSPAIADAPTPAAIILIATAPPPIVPTPAAQIERVGANTTVRALVAYDAPDGQALGAIEAGRSYQVLASYGASWLQADVTGSGVVWLRAADLLGMPGGLVDLQPTPAPRIVVVSAPAPAYTPPTPDYQTMNEPPTPQMSDHQAQILRDHFLAGREVEQR